MAGLGPINPIQGPGIPEIPQIGRAQQEYKKDGQSAFSDVLNGVIKDVNKAQHTADQSVQKFATGEIKDVHQVMIAMNEADVAFKLMMEIRNKLLGAYKEIIKTPV